MSRAPMPCRQPVCCSMHEKSAACGSIVVFVAYIVCMRRWCRLESLWLRIGAADVAASTAQIRRSSGPLLGIPIRDGLVIVLCSHEYNIAAQSVWLIVAVRTRSSSGALSWVTRNTGWSGTSSIGSISRRLRLCSRVSFAKATLYRIGLSYRSAAVRLLTPVWAPTGFIESEGGDVAGFLAECRSSLADEFCALFEEDVNKEFVERVLAVR